MIDRTPIRDAVDRLEEVHHALAATATRTNDRRRHDLVALRKSLSSQIVEVCKVVDPFFASPANAALAQDYRRKLSAMRTAAALHQAEWPAVRLGEAVADYEASVHGVRAANRDFVGWIRQALADRPRQP